ncbi:hypothetical protein Zm00014a_030476 [Zea mays]|uniref:Uncharacterized protein n=1 Tax=Zea mays TaxID=4577 RepID=A0A3L6FLW4_MAIZE|nr:hypothetical protein Zm00014a_030476 [Zea mays]
MFARTMVIPIYASLRTSTSVEWLAFFSMQNTGFISSTKQKQNSTHTQLIIGKQRRCGIEQVLLQSHRG